MAAERGTAESWSPAVECTRSCRWSCATEGAALRALMGRTWGGVLEGPAEGSSLQMASYWAGTAGWVDAVDCTVGTVHLYQH